jgi:hypothetical protein
MGKRSERKPSNPMRATVGMGYGGNMPAKIAKHLKKGTTKDQQKPTSSVSAK